ncbi:MAG: PAS domain S-box protein [Dehalococcoidia bacterium]
MARISRSRESKSREGILIESTGEADIGLGDFTGSSTDSFLLFDEDLNCVGINPAGQTLFNVSEEDVAGKSILDIMPETEDSRAHERYRDVIRTGEHLVTSSNLGERCLGIKAFKVGNGLGIIASDITERKLMEETLHKADEYWRSLFNSLEDVVLTIDRDHNVENINDSGLALLGKNREEVVGAKCYQVIYDREKPEGSCPLSKILKSKKAESVDRALFGKHFSTRISPIFDENGEIVRFVELLRDVTGSREAKDELNNHPSHLEELVQERTAELKNANDRLQREMVERKQAEGVLSGHGSDLEALVEERTTELRNANEKLEQEIDRSKQAGKELRAKDSAIALSLNAVVIADLEGKLTYVNRSFLRMWGYDSERKVLGKPVVNFWQVREEAAEVVDILREEGSWMGELAARRKDGSTFDVELSAGMVPDEHGEPICMTVSLVDISERRRVEERLRECEGRLGSISAKSIEWVRRLSTILDTAEEVSAECPEEPGEEEAQEE